MSTFSRDAPWGRPSVWIRIDGELVVMQPGEATLTNPQGVINNSGRCPVVALLLFTLDLEITSIALKSVSFFLNFRNPALASTVPTSLAWMTLDSLVILSYLSLV